MFDPRETNRLALQTVTPTDDRKVAYIKAMRSEEVGFLSAEAPLLVAGYQVFVVCASRTARRCCLPTATPLRQRSRTAARSKPSACEARR
jgi:hypothetical protein